MRQEPTADMRYAAKGIREMFEAYVDAGFTELQVLILLGVMMGVAAQGQQKPNV